MMQQSSTHLSTLEVKQLLCMHPAWKCVAYSPLICAAKHASTAISAIDSNAFEEVMVMLFCWTLLEKEGNGEAIAIVATDCL